MVLARIHPKLELGGVVQVLDEYEKKGVEGPGRQRGEHESAAKDLVNLTKTLICNHTELMTRVQQKVEGSDFSLNFCVSQHKASWS